MIPSLTANPGTSGMAQALSRGGVRGISSRRVRVLRDCPERKRTNARIAEYNATDRERHERAQLEIDRYRDKHGHTPRTDEEKASWVWRPFLLELGPSTPPSTSKSVRRLVKDMRIVQLGSASFPIGPVTALDVAETLGDL